MPSQFIAKRNHSKERSVRSRLHGLHRGSARSLQEPVSQEGDDDGSKGGGGLRFELENPVSPVAAGGVVAFHYGCDGARNLLLCLP